MMIELEPHLEKELPENIQLIRNFWRDEVLSKNSLEKVKEVNCKNETKN